MPSREGRKREEKEQNDQVADCIGWNEEQVAQFIDMIGYPQYKACFVLNYITGRKLIWMDASNLPRIGIHDFEHIKHIAKNIRQILAITEPDYWRCLSRGRRQPLELYLELKSKSGERSEVMTYAKFLRANPDVLKV